MAYQEKDFQLELRHKHNHKKTFFSEQKIAKGKSIRFDAVQEHQIRFLLSVAGLSDAYEGLFYKFNDFYIKNKTLKKPFDSFYAVNEEAYIIIMFYEPYKKKNVYWIPIQDWILLEQEFLANGRKSIKEEELKQAAVKIQDFTK